jgi:hypothetical protein
MIYLSFNDPPSGIYYSQVTDVCKFIRSELNEPVRLVAFVSVRNYFNSRRAIRAAFASACVIPMYPGVRNWRRNLWMLGRMLRTAENETIIARGPFAAYLAIQLRKKKKGIKVCFDARGAYTAEFNEYDVSGNQSLKTEIRQIEQEVLFDSDKQIAVSKALTSYWEKEFEFSTNMCQIIPCTLAADYLSDIPLGSSLRRRSELGVKEDEVLLVYSGSNAGWQSLYLVFEFLEKLMERDKKVKLLFLSPQAGKGPLFSRFGSRIIHQWVSPAEVKGFLIACDYGILIREDTVTNAVSSPVKFAEYLACGLKMIISGAIGDYSDFVKEQRAGILVTGELPQELKRPAQEEKMRMMALGKKYFSKNAFVDSYKRILE